MARTQHYLSAAGSCRAVMIICSLQTTQLPAGTRSFYSQKKRFPGGAACHGWFMMSLLLQVRRSQAGLVSNPWKGVGFTEIHKEENLERNSGILKYILMVSLFHNSSFTFLSRCLSLLAVKNHGAKSQRVLSCREEKQYREEEGKQQRNKNPSEPGSCV